MIERAHALAPETESLDSVARRLFGTSYIRLNDEQADAVWNEIEKSES